MICIFAGLLILLSVASDEELGASMSLSFFLLKLLIGSILIIIGALQIKHRTK